MTATGVTTALLRLPAWRPPVWAGFGGTTTPPATAVTGNNPDNCGAAGHHPSRTG